MQALLSGKKSQKIIGITSIFYLHVFLKLMFTFMHKKISSNKMQHVKASELALENTLIRLLCICDTL